MPQWTKLIRKNMKTLFLTLFLILKNLEERLNVLSKQRRYKKKIKLLDMQTMIFKMKNYPRFVYQLIRHCREKISEFKDIVVDTVQGQTCKDTQTQSQMIKKKGAEDE